MRNLLFNLLITLLLSITINLNAQTIVNYGSWNGASGCNIFANSTNVPSSVNGNNSNMAHLTAIGQPVYDNVNKSVNLDSRINSGQNQGTEYRMTVNFLQGFSYKITVTAARIMSSQTGPNVLLRLDLNSGGSGNNTQCNGTGVIDANASGGLKRSYQIGSTSFSDYVFDYTPLISPQTYMMVAAIPPAGSVPQTILIQKIKIEQTPPPATFTITPNPIPIVCGKTNPVTLTINNVNNTSGVTGYTWNLGTGNTWIYNGSPAPASIATTTNTLTLSPTCGITLGSVSATVSVGTLNYPTNTATVSSTNETLSISGLDPLCSGSAVYSVANLPPCGATVTVWAASPSGIVSVTNNGNNTATISKLADGQVTITATVNSTCTGNTTVTFPLLVGGSYGDDFTINSSTYAGCYGLFEMLDLQAFPKYTTKNYSVSYEWSYLKESTTEPTVWTSLPCNYSSCTVSFYEEGTYQLRLITTDDCGKQNTTIKNITISESCNGSGYFRLSASPNPASNDLYVTIDNESEELKKNTKGLLNVQLNLYDLNTGQMIQQWKKSNNQKQYLLSVGGIKRGQYILQVVKGKYKASKIILIN